MPEQNYVQTMQNILAHKSQNQDLSIQDCKQLFANLMSLTYFSNNQALNQQMCCNSALLLGAYVNSHDFKVHVDTNADQTADYHVKITALPEHPTRKSSKG